MQNPIVDIIHDLQQFRNSFCYNNFCYLKKMELSERLLHNEIQNLGQIVQIMSYEMTLLSDFMKEKFGSSFESFRARHSQQAKVPLSSRKTNLTARKSTTHLKRENPGSSSSFSTEAKKSKTSENPEDEDADACPEDVGNDSPVYGDGDNGNDDHGDNVSVCSNDFPEGAEILSFETPKNESERSLGGRNRMEIWNRYIVAKLPNGKLSAKCRKCFNYVSCKTERLTLHYTKCVVEGMSFSRKHSGVAFTKNKSSKKSTEEEDKKTVTDYLAAKKGTSQEGGDKIRGRGKDPVWDYYNTIEDPCSGKTIVRCKNCDTAVSGKVERLRRHFIVCHKLEDDDDNDGRGGGGSDDDE